MARIAQRYEVNKWKNGEINTGTFFKPNKGGDCEAAVQQIIHAHG